MILQKNYQLHKCSEYIIKIWKIQFIEIDRFGMRHEY